MLTSNAPVRTLSYNYKNLVCPQISKILTTLGYDFSWLEESDLMPLVSMGTFPNDIALLDAILNSYDNENSTVTMTVHGKPVSFSIKPSNIHRLRGLPFKDSAEQVNTKVALLSENDKILLETNYGIHAKCLTGKIVTCFLFFLLILKFFEDFYIIKI